MFSPLWQVRIYKPFSDWLNQNGMPKPQGRILLVDDEPVVRSVVRMCLVSWRFEVVEAGDGVEALAAVDAAESDFDLLVSDFEMPRMDGATLARSWSRKYPSIPVLLISGNPEGAYKMQSAGVGRWAFLPKPFIPKDLCQKVVELLASRTP